MTENDNKFPTLVFIYPETFADAQIGEDLEEVQMNGLDLRVIKKDIGAFASFEWVIPTAFGAYILKPYFDAFLSEAGKDHYNSLKNTLIKLIKKGKHYKTSLVAASQSIYKLSNVYSQSFVVSLEFQTADKRHLKMLFDNNLEFTDWQNGLVQMLTLLESNYELFPNDNLTKQIEKLNTKEHRIVYVIIDSETKELDFFDDNKMLEKYK